MSLRIGPLALLLVACAGSGASVPPPRAKAPLPAPRVGPGALEARPLLGDLPTRAIHAGAGALAIVASGPMSEGERAGAFVDVPRDACLLAYARSSASLEDIDLAAFAEEGNPVAVDEGPDAKPTILLCPPHPDRVYVAVHAASGEGLCAIAAQLVPRERGPEVALAVGARGALGGAPRSPEAWPGLEEQVRAHRTKIGGAWDEQRRVAVSVDARSVAAVAFGIEEGGCTDALVVPDEDVAVLDVDVLDSEGRLVARAKESGASRAVTVCSPIAIAGTLQLRPHVGRGLAAVVTAKAKAEGTKDLLVRPEVVWAASVEPIEAARSTRNAALAKAGYGAATVTTNGHLQLGKRITSPVDLASGACTRIDVVAGAPLAHIEAAAWDDSGALLATDEGSAAATLFACGRGRARVDLGTRGRPGPFAILARPEKWHDPAFAALPLASGRMLGRAAASPTRTMPGQVGQVQRASLDSGRQHVQTVSIPPSRCLTVAIGAQGEGTGLEARVFDAVTGEELDRSHGQHAADVRACSADATRSVRVEVRATAGKLDAVVGERFVPSK